MERLFTEIENERNINKIYTIIENYFENHRNDCNKIKLLIDFIKRKRIIRFDTILIRVLILVCPNALELILDNMKVPDRLDPVLTTMILTNVIGGISVLERYCEKHNIKFHHNLYVEALQSNLNNVFYISKITPEIFDESLLENNNITYTFNEIDNNEMLENFDNFVYMLIKHKYYFSNTFFNFINDLILRERANTMYKNIVEEYNRKTKERIKLVKEANKNDINNDNDNDYNDEDDEDDEINIKELAINLVDLLNPDKITAGLTDPHILANHLIHVFNTILIPTLKSSIKERVIEIRDEILKEAFDILIENSRNTYGNQNPTNVRITENTFDVILSQLFQIENLDGLLRLEEPLKDTIRNILNYTLDDVPTEAEVNMMYYKVLEVLNPNERINNQSNEIKYESEESNDFNESDEVKYESEDEEIYNIEPENRITEFIVADITDQITELPSLSEIVKNPVRLEENIKRLLKTKINNPTEEEISYLNKTVREFVEEFMFNETKQEEIKHEEFEDEIKRPLVPKTPATYTKGRITQIIIHKIIEKLSSLPFMIKIIKDKQKLRENVELILSRIIPDPTEEEIEYTITSINDFLYELIDNEEIEPKVVDRETFINELFDVLIGLVNEEIYRRLMNEYGYDRQYNEEKFQKALRFIGKDFFNIIKKVYDNYLKRNVDEGNEDIITILTEDKHAINAKIVKYFNRKHLKDLVQQFFE